MLTAVPLIIFLLLLVAGYFEVRKSRLAKQSIEWPKVNAVVMSIAIDKREIPIETDERTKFEVLYEPEIEYKYRVNSKSYLGSQIWFGEKLTKSYGDITQSLAGIKKGSTISISYNPNNPGQAVMMPGIRKSSFYKVLAIGIGLILIFCILVFCRFIFGDQCNNSYF